MSEQLAYKRDGCNESSLLLLARKELTDLAGWQDCESTADLISRIDAWFGPANVPKWAHGAHDSGW